MSHSHHHSRETVFTNNEAKQNMEKFRVLLEHWIEHNDAHGAEFEKWARRAQAADLNQVSQGIAAAAEGLRLVNDRLRDAMGCLPCDVKENFHVSE